MRLHRLSLCLLLAAAGCQPAPRVIATGPFPPSTGRVGARARVEAPARQQDASWAFVVSGSACEATAAGQDVTLTLRVGNDRVLRLAVTTGARASLPGRAGMAVQVAFAGAEGSWTLPGRRTAGRGVALSLPLDETSVGQARAVLGGGAMRLVGRDSVPGLVVPDAGVAGRDWFGCVRSKLAASPAAPMPRPQGAVPEAPA